MTKPTKWHVHPAKTQISVVAVHIKKATNRAHSEDSDHFVGFVMLRLLIGKKLC